jgi:hypothetical protein
MPRKLLFLVFTNDPCRRNHAFLYALDLARHGHQVQIVLEGEATRCLRERQGRFGELFAEAVRLGLLAGACKTASGGCATGDPAREVTDLAEEAGVPLLDAMQGHAGIAPFVNQGFEIVTFS